MLKKYGSRVIYAADEFYLKADRDIPPYEDYEDFPQIENGVGLIASLREEFDEALAEVKEKRLEREISIVSGKAAYPLICGFKEKLIKKIKGLKINVYEITNNFFGEQITVCGLLTGSDIKAQLEGKELGEGLLIPHSALRSGEDVFLDDITLSELEESLKVPIIPVYNDGYEFIDAVLGREEI